MAINIYTILYGPYNVSVHKNVKYTNDTDRTPSGETRISAFYEIDFIPLRGHP